MKLILFTLLACGMFASTYSQTEPGEPCCSIITMDIQKNMVIARDNTTGRLYQFKADAMEMRSIRKGDAVAIAGKKISAINGSIRNYPSITPDYQEPCCGVVSVQTDGAKPCCSLVTIKNNSTNNNLSISVPKQIAATLKAGQAVFIDAANNLVVVQSAFGGSNGEMNSFGYPATSQEGTTSNDKTTDKWVITPVTNMKGVLGRLNMNFPDGVEWNIWIYTQADKKMVNSFYQSHNTKSYNLSPGEYRLLLTNVPVENVPIKKGNDTRLKAGFLNLVSEGSWELYDALKQNIYTSNTKPQKIALPVGSYQLNLGGQFYAVILKDGETVEY